MCRRYTHSDASLYVAACLNYTMLTSTYGSYINFLPLLVCSLCTLVITVARATTTQGN